MKIKITITIIIIFIIGVVVVTMQSGGINPNPEPSYTVTPVATPTTIATTTIYSMADIVKHNSVTSCWTAIDGIVYDVTSWINRHPGGPQAILSLCGKDGSPAFKNQHEGEPKPAMMLATFKIGVIK